MRRFYLDREIDISGVTGLGHVAEGVQLSDGRVVMRWAAEPSSIVIHAHIDHVTKIHGHFGATRLIWIDQEASMLEHVLERKE